MCDVVILVMCAMYWVFKFVHWFCHCYVTKSVKNHLFKIIWDSTIKVNAYGCRPESLNSFDCSVVQTGAFYDDTHCIDHICILEFVQLCYVTWWTMYTLLSLYPPWIRNVFGLHIYDTSIRPQMVISPFCWRDNFCNIWCSCVCNACNVLCYFVFNHFVFVLGMLKNNMRYLIPIKLVQQCMKQLGGQYNVCIYYHHKSPRTVATKWFLSIVHWYEMVHFVRRNEILIVFFINTLHL